MRHHLDSVHANTLPLDQVTLEIDMDPPKMDILGGQTPMNGSVNVSMDTLIDGMSKITRKI